MREVNELGNTVDLKTILEILRNRVLFIVSVTLVMILLAGIISYKVITPTYESTTQILVNPNTDQVFNSQEISASIQLINTYNGIIKSPMILSQVIEELGLAETTESLTERIIVNNVEDSQILTITVRDESIEEAVKIANATATVFQSEIQNLMNVDNVNILSPAKVPLDPTTLEPGPVINMAIGGVIGLVMGIGLVLMLEQLNTTVRTEDDIEDLGLQMLGAVSPIPKSKAFDHKAKESGFDAEQDAVNPASSS